MDGKLNGDKIRNIKCTMLVRLSRCLKTEIVKKNQGKTKHISLKLMELLASKFCGLFKNQSVNTDVLN